MTLETELKELCVKYSINDVVFNQALNILNPDLTPGTVLKKEHATTFIMSTGIDHPFDEKEAEEVVKIIASQYPEQFKLIQHGDVFENTSDRGHGYRSNGMHMFVVESGNVSIINLSYYPDDYGSMPSLFKGIDEFPLDYWDDTTQISLGGAYGGAYWHGGSPDVALSDSIKKLLQPVTEETREFIKNINPPPLPNINFDYYNYTITYKNKLYLIPDYQEPLYVNNQSVYIFNL